MARTGRSGFGGPSSSAGFTAAYEAFCAVLRALGVDVATGVFGARMRVELANDGPVTIVLD